LRSRSGQSPITDGGLRVGIVADDRNFREALLQLIGGFGAMAIACHSREVQGLAGHNVLLWDECRWPTHDRLRLLSRSTVGVVWYSGFAPKDDPAVNIAIARPHLAASYWLKKPAHGAELLSACQAIADIGSCRPEHADDSVVAI
jgi:hypothetical protein